MDFTIIFYHDKSGKSPIEDFLRLLNKSNSNLVVKTRKGIQKLKDRVYHREPLSKHLDLGLWELRIKSGSDILRIIYTFSRGRIIILLHIFIKKQQKTPARELEIAQLRLKEVFKNEKSKR